MSEDKEFYDYIFLIPGKEFSINFVNSWTNTLIYLHETGYTFASSFKYAPIIQEVRNQLITYPIKLENGPTRMSSFRRHNKSVFNETAYCDRVIFLDSDMVWSLDDIKKLLHTNLDIVCGAYSLETGSEMCVVGKDGLFVDSEEIKIKTEPFEIMGAGMGFVSVKYEVLEKMGFPWFNTLYVNDEEGGTQFIGEDTFFFYRAQELGYKVYCDPTIRIGHEKKKIIGL